MADANIRIIIQAVDNASAELSKVKSALSGMSTAGGEASKSTQSLETKSKASFLGISGAVAMVTAAIVAMKKVWDFAEQGAQLLSLESVSSKIAKSMGANMDDIVSSIQEASLGTISYYDAMQSASNAMMLGLGTDADKLGNLMEIAALRGRAMGLTTSQAFSDIVRGIGRMSPLILDNLGIVIDAENRYKTYAAGIGKTASELTSSEKKQALFNGVLEEGNKLLADAGGLSADYATGMQRANVALKDTWNALKTNVGSQIGALFLTDAERKKVFSEEERKIYANTKSWDEYIRAVGDAGMVLKLITYFGDDTIYTLGGLTEAQYKYNKASEEANITREIEIRRIEMATNANNELKYSMQDIDHEFALSIGLSQELTNVQEDYFSKIKKGGKNAKNAIGELSDDINKFLFESAQATDMLSVSATTSLGFALGQIDQKSWVAGLAIEQLTNAMDTNRNGMIDSGKESDSLSKAMQILAANANAAIQDRSATWTINMLLNGVAMPASSSLGWSYMPGRIGAYYSAPRPDIPGLASGGSVSGGNPYIVGEHGSELFVPQDNGTIIPNNKMSNVGGKNVTIQITYAPTISTASESELEWALKPMIQRALREA